MIYGYKCFNKGLINRYGKQFEVGKTYHCEKDIIFGNNGHAFHMCKNLEDTLRYFDAMDNEVDICLIKGFGKHAEYEDTQNDYYDMYAFEYITIVKKLTRKEIIDYGLSLYEYRAERFVSQFRLTKEEIALFKTKFAKSIHVLNSIAYYQEGDKDVYKRYYEKYTKKRTL